VVSEAASVTEAAAKPVAAPEPAIPAAAATLERESVAAPAPEAEKEDKPKKRGWWSLGR
jgi:ribonuclease E